VYFEVGILCFRVGVDPEEEDKKSTFVSVSTVGFVFTKWGCFLEVSVHFL